MKELETFVKTFGEGLRTLAQGVHAIADKLDSYVGSSDDGNFDTAFNAAADDGIRAEAVEETPDKTTPRKKPAVNATAVVFEIISGAGKSITMDELQKETGYDKKKLSNILHRLKKQDKIKSVKKGVYAVK
jgi:predicted Rossmann fold nucleotide-binding protein DprA/Smf involved in DNA uptake